MLCVKNNSCTFIKSWICLVQFGEKGAPIWNNVYWSEKVMWATHKGMQSSSEVQLLTVTQIIPSLQKEFCFSQGLSSVLFTWANDFFSLKTRFLCSTGAVLSATALEEVNAGVVHCASILQTEGICLPILQMQSCLC